MNEGYVMLSRRLFENKLWLEKRQLSKCEAWIDLIATAAFSDHSRIIDGCSIDVPRGSLVASERFLATRWRWSRNKIRNYLKMLSDDCMVTLQSVHNHTLITLCNFDTYNMNGTTLGTKQGPPEVPPSVPPGDQREEGKEGRKKGNKGKGALAELCAYAVELGLPESDGEALFHRWTGNGWTNGKKPICDWRATMRTFKAYGYLASQKPNGGAAQQSERVWAESPMPQVTLTELVMAQLNGDDL